NSSTLLNRRQLACVIGLAGAGKSTLLSAAKDAWERQGYRVVGAALAGKAADGLQSSSGITSRTLHALEHGWKQGKNKLQASDVLVVDEAGMVGTAQMGRVIAHVKEQNAKLVLVGDPQQLQPIQAGTPFKDIADAIGHAELSEIRRQKADWQKAASRALARGETKSALEAYSDHGMVEHCESEHDAITALVEDYMVDWELHGKSKTRVALAHRREDVAAINHAIRCARKSAGEVDNEYVFKTDFGGRAFAPGDRILFTRNDYDFNVKNGMLGWVTCINGDQISVALDTERNTPKRNVTIKANRFSSFDHGYATTIHKAQGATVDHSFVLKTKTMDRHLEYVAMTRHRGELRLYEACRATRAAKDSIGLHPTWDYGLEL
ncbi:MAG: AAA family ATPase, partial [Pseudomonadota bacterium]